MKTISAELRAHYQGEQHTLSGLWKVTRKDLAVYGFTDHDEILVFSGLSYDAASGFSASAVRARTGLNVDGLEVQGAIDSSIITAESLRSGAWDNAVVEEFEVNWADLSQGARKLTHGIIGKVSQGSSVFIAEVDSFLKRLQQPIGRLVVRPCDAKLGDARCTVNLAGFTVSSTITSVSSKRVFTDSARAEAANYFAKGEISFTSGANAGQSYDVKTFGSGGIIGLQLPAWFTVAIGDAYTMVAGCDKLDGTCVTKFANIVNYRGFPFVPGLQWQQAGKL